MILTYKGLYQTLLNIILPSKIGLDTVSNFTLNSMPVDNLTLAADSRGAHIFLTIFKQSVNSI